MDSLTSERLRALAAVSALPEGDRRVAKETAEHLSELERTRAGLAQSRAAMKDLSDDIARFQEHLRALGGEKGAGAAAGDNPFVQRVLKGEDRLTTLRKEIQGLETEENHRLETVRTSLARLSSPSKHAQTLTGLLTAP
jgi:hypothetical protein